MEILGGMAKGISLKVPGGALVRPTAVRARRALFDSLGDLGGGSVCDLFAGSGAVGVEFAGRGGIRIVCGKVAAVTFRAQIESQENRTALFFLPFYRIQRDTAGVCRPVLIASRAGFYFCGPAVCGIVGTAGRSSARKIIHRMGGTFPDDLGTSGSEFPVEGLPAGMESSNHQTIRRDPFSLYREDVIFPEKSCFCRKNEKKCRKICL